MHRQNNNKGSFIGFVPLLTFLAIYFGMGIGTGSFENLPLLIGMFVATILSFVISSPVATKKTFEEKVEIFTKGGGDSTLILMIIIYMLAGAFSAIAGAMHATDTVNKGIMILPSQFILPGMFIIGSILSFSMGTSMGSIPALMPVGIAVAEKTGVSLPLIAGIIVGSAMFGDNLSFISDTTIAACTSQNVSMKAKFKANLLMIFPAFVLNTIALAFWPIDAAVIDTTAAQTPVNLINLLPYALIIILSLIGVHAITTMSISILSGVVIGLIHGDFTFLECLKIIHKGMMLMQDMAIIAMLIGGVIAMMKYLGGIDWLLNNLAKNTKTQRGAEFSIAALVSLVDMAVAKNTMAIIAVGPIAKDISKQYDVPAPRTAAIIDIFSAAFNGLTPYAGQILVAAAMASISPVSIMPYVWYSMLMIIFGLLFIALGIGSNTGRKQTVNSTDK